MVVIFLTPISIFANKSSLSIAYPPNHSLHSETTLNVVVNVNPNNVDTIQIITSTGKKKIDIVDFKVTYCKSILLKLGENRITVRTYKDSTMIDEQISRVYVKSEIHHEYRYPPKIYDKTFFHINDKEVECARCHDMSVNEVEGVAFIDVKESNCYQCHNNITKDKFAHAPAVNWLCTSCHDGKTSSDNDKYAGASKYIAAEPVNDACFKCHKDNYKQWGASRYRHEPLDSGHCNKCHNPHSSPYNMFVRKPVDQICLGCHKDKHTKARMLPGSNCAGTSEKKLCVECHTPHASNRAFFIKEPEKKK